MNPQETSDQHSPELGEYHDQRDMDLFWKEVRPRREPIQQRWYIPLVLLIVVVSVPWYWKQGVTGKIIAGLPLWIWITILCSLVISVITATMALRQWDDEDVSGRGEEEKNSGNQSRR